MPNVSIRQLRVFACALLLLAGLTTQVDAQSTAAAATTGAPAPHDSRRYVAPTAPLPSRSPQPVTQPVQAPPAEGGKLPDIIYIQPLLGGGYVNLKSLDASNFDPETVDPGATPQDFVKTSKGSGLRYGVAGGINIIFLHLGGRLAFTQTPGFTLGTAQFEAALVPKIGPVEPSFRVGIGYAWQGDASYASEIKKATSVYGLALGAGIGLDIRLGQVLGIGVGFDADLLNMSRSTDLSEATVIKASSGSAVGVQVALTGHLTLHI